MIRSLLITIGVVSILVVAFMTTRWIGRPSGSPVDEAFAMIRPGATVAELGLTFPYKLRALRSEESLRRARDFAAAPDHRKLDGQLILRNVFSDSGDPLRLSFGKGVVTNDGWSFGADPRLARLRLGFRNWMPLEQLLALLPAGVDARVFEEGVDLFETSFSPSDPRLRTFKGTLSHLTNDGKGTSRFYNIVVSDL